jgi:hypothetical protein
MFDICGKLTSQNRMCHSLALKQVDEVLLVGVICNSVKRV